MSADPQRTRARIEQATILSVQSPLYDLSQHQRTMAHAAAREALQMVKERLVNEPLDGSFQTALNTRSRDAQIVGELLADLASDEAGKET